MKKTPGIVAYLDFSEATIAAGAATFSENIQKKIESASQVWALNVPVGESKILSGPCNWDGDNAFAVFGQEGYYTVEGAVATYVAPTPPGG